MEPVSVVIPTYNRAHLIEPALNSVLSATKTGDEIVVVDDGSTDDTRAVVCAARAPWANRVRYICVPNGGAGRARNAGIAAATNDLIAFADSDDVWLPWRLDVERPVLELERSLGFCFSNFGQLHKDGRTESAWLVQWSRDPRPWSQILGTGRLYADSWMLPADLSHMAGSLMWYVGSMYRQELTANYINVNTMLVRRSVVGDALRFGTDLPTYEDWECYARITRVAPCAYIDVDTALQRAHDGPRLTDASDLVSIQTRIAIIERHWARDDTFLHEHGGEVHANLQALRRIELRHLIATGRRREAQAHLRCHGGGLAARVAVMLPEALLQRLVNAARAVRS